MHIMFQYLANLIHNILFIIHYKFTKYFYPNEHENHTHATINAMIQLLKYNIKFIRTHAKFSYKEQSIQVELITIYNQQIICFIIRNITTNTNNNHYTYMIPLIDKHKEFFGKDSNIKIFTSGMPILHDIINIITNKHPDITIYNNVIPFLHVPHKPKNTHKLAISHKHLGKIIMYNNNDNIYNNIIHKLNKYELYVCSKAYDAFQHRMNTSRNAIKQLRWNTFKQSLNIIQYDDINDYENISLDRFELIKISRFNRYAIANNFTLFAHPTELIKNFYTQSQYTKYICNFDYLPQHPFINIYGSKSDNIFQQSNKIYKFITKIIYHIQIYYYIYIQ